MFFLIDSIIRLDLASGELVLGMTAMTLMGSNPEWVQPRVVSISRFRREIGEIPDAVRGGSFSVTLNNSDGWFSRLKSENVIIGRTAKLQIGDPSKGLDDFSTLATGLIRQWSGRDVIQVDVDTSIDGLTEVFTRTITPEIFPDAPEQSIGETVPVVIGRFAGLEGSLPAIRINDSGRYLCCYGRVGISKVFTEVNKVTAEVSFTAQEARWPLPSSSDYYTTVQITPAPSDAAVIRWNSTGEYSSGAFTDSKKYYSSPADILEKLLTEYLPTGTTVDSTSFGRVESAQSARGIIASFAVITRSTLREVMQRFASSANMTCYPTGTGKVGLAAPAGYYVPSDPVRINEGSIQRNTMIMRGPSLIASEIPFRFGLIPATGVYQKVASAEDQTLSNQLGTKRFADSLDMTYIQDQVAAAAIAKDRLFYLGEGRTIVECSIDPRLVRDLQIGDVIYLKHFAGLGDDGFEGQQFLVIGSGIDWRKHIPVGTLRLVDMDLKIGKVSLEFLDYQPPAPVVHDTVLARYSISPADHQLS